MTELHSLTNLKKRILVVEDNEMHCLITQDCLEAEGHIVKSLPDGLRFWEALAEFQPDLLLLDLKLPLVDGFTLLEQLRESTWSTTPVIITSAYAFQKEKQRAMKLGIQAYLTKPIKLDVLLQAVKEFSEIKLTTQSVIDCPAQ